MDTARFRLLRLSGVLVVALALSACELGTQKQPTTSPTTTGLRQTVIFPPNQLGITTADQLPNPCALVSAETVSELLGSNLTGVPADGTEYDGVAMLFRTCQWGATDGPDGAIGVQIGVPNEAGRDVVYNRSTVMDPALDVSIGEDGRENLYMGELPTGGAKGSTIFFRTQGYSVLIGHVGPGAALESVEQLGTEALTALGG